MGNSNISTLDRDKLRNEYEFLHSVDNIRYGEVRVLKHKETSEQICLKSIMF
jgi:hypothetical protein